MYAKDMYQIEHKFGNFTIIDDTEEDAEYSLEIKTAGKILLWKEASYFQEDEKKKISYYRLPVDNSQLDGIKKDEINEKFQEGVFIGLITNPGQSLKTQASDTIKKVADTKKQTLMITIMLGLSFLLNAILLAQQLANPEENFIQKITLANTGWLVCVVLVIKLIDTSQEKPAIMGELYVRYWGKVFCDPVGDKVEVAYVTFARSSKLKISESLLQGTSQLETDHILIHEARANKAEDKARLEKMRRINEEEAKKVLQEKLANIEKRIDTLVKQAYAEGQRDANTTVELRRQEITSAINWERVIQYAITIIIAIVFVNIIRSMSLNMPESSFLITLNDIPLIGWIVIFVLGLSLIRYIFELLGVRR